MRRFSFLLAGFLALAFFLPACTGGPAKGIQEQGPSHPPPPEELLGSGSIPAKYLEDFFLLHNPGVELPALKALITYYIEEAGIEGINYEVAFAQMCLETGFLRFGGLVVPEMNNFCGLGALSREQPGEYFETPKIGVRAHIQHLKAYATDAPLRQALVDPRYRYVRKGAAPAINGLAGTWAADKDYAGKIRAILERLYAFSYEKPR